MDFPEDHYNCPFCNFIVDSAPFCTMCGKKNTNFNEKDFIGEYGQTLSQKKLEQCTDEHGELRAEYQREFPGQSPLYCDLCGEELTVTN